MASRVLLPVAGAMPDTAALYYRRKNVFFAMLIAISISSLITSSWSVALDQRGTLYLYWYLLLTVTLALVALFTACMVAAN